MGKIRKYNLGFIGAGIDENFGSGKTLFLAAIAYENWQAYDIVYANFHLNAKIIPNAYFLNEITKDVIFDLRKNSLLLLHESYNYFDRRYCLEKTNKKIMYAIFQMRKFNIDIFADIPRLNYLDFRVTDNATQYWQSYGNPYYGHSIYDPYFVYADMAHLKKYFISQNEFTIKNKFVHNMEKYYGCYDTTENINIDDSTEKIKKKEKITLNNFK